MSEELDYTQLLDKIDEKLENYNAVEKVDISEIKDLVSQIDSRMTENQARENFDAIKEKLENLSTRLDGTSFDSFQELKHDIEFLVDNNENITNSLEKIQNLQNLTMTSAEFEEFQRQQLDLALKSNDDIFARLTEIQENTKAFKKINGIERIGEELERINDKLVARVQEILHDFKVDTSNLPKAPIVTTSESGESTLPPDSLEIQYKSVRQTYKYVKELKESLETLKNKDLSAQLAKIDEIYENMLTIETWTKEMNLLNSTFENMVVKLSKSINLQDLTEKLDVLSDDISNLNDQSDKIDYIAKQLDKIQKKSLDGSLSDESAEKITSMIAKIKGSMGASLTEMPEFDDLCSKVDIVYESLSALNVWASKLDNIQEQLEIIKSAERQITTVEGTPIINNEADFEELRKTNSEVEEKINTIIENVNIINDRLSEIDLGEQLKNKVDSKLEEANSEISQKIDEISRNINNFNEEINNINLVAKVSEELDDNIHSINNELSQKIGNISATVEDLNKEIANLNIKEALKTELNDKFEELNSHISGRIDDICENIQRINSGSDSEYIRENILENISAIRDDLTAKLSDNTSSDEINDKIVELNNEITQKLDDVQSFVQSNNTDLTDQIKNELKELVDSLNFDVTNRLETIQAYLPADNSGLIVQLKEQVDVLTNELDDHLSVLSNDLKPELDNVIDSITNNISLKLSDVVNDRNNNVESIISSIDEIKDSVMKYDYVSQLTETLNDRFEEISTVVNTNVETINSAFNDINSLLSRNFAENQDNISREFSSLINNINDLSNKADSSSDNLTFLQEEVRNIYQELETVTERFDTTDFTFSEFRDDIKREFEKELNKFSDTLQQFKDKLSEDSNELSEKINGLSSDIISLKDRTEDTLLDIGALRDSIEDVNEKIETSALSLSDISESIRTESLSSDKHYDHLKSEIKEIKQQNVESSDDLKYVINEVGNSSMNIVDVKEQLDDLSKEFVNLTGSNERSANNYVYTLFDVESDLIKIHKILNENTKFTDDNIRTIKVDMDSITNDISSISKRTNKLIVNSDEANKKFRAHLEDLAKTITELQDMRYAIETTMQVTSLEQKISTLSDSNEKINDSIIESNNRINDAITNTNSRINNAISESNNNIRNALSLSNNKMNEIFSHLAHWIDTVDNSLSIIKSNQNEYSENTRNKVQEYCSDILNKLSELKSSTENAAYGYYTDILKELDNFKISQEAKDESYHNEILVKLAELKAKHNSQLDLLLNNDDYYKNFTEQFEKIINKIHEIETKNSENYKMLLNSEKIFIKLFDRLEYLDDKTYLTKIIKKIENFEDKTVLIKLLQKIEKISKTNSQKVIKQIENLPDADTVSVKTLEILSPIFEELLKSIQKQGKTNNDAIKGIAAKTDAQLKLAQGQEKKQLEQTDILEKYNSRLIEQAKIMDNLNAKLVEQNKIAEEFEGKLSEQSNLFDKFDTKLSIQSKTVLELKEEYTKKIDEQTNIINEQSAKITKLEKQISELEDSNSNLEKLLDKINTKLSHFDSNITKLVNYIEE